MAEKKQKENVIINIPPLNATHIIILENHIKRGIYKELFQSKIITEDQLNQLLNN